MKKIVLIVATMALTLVSSCNKELNTDITTPSNSETHELFVSLPKLMDAETKATIAEANGGFSWTAGDFIAVKTSTNDVYKFTAAGSGNSVRFTYTGEMNGAPTTVVYPYTDDAKVAALPTEITGLTGALGEDGIRLSGTVSDNAVSMDYENAFLKVSFSNVPTFASSIVFDGNINDVTIDFTPLASKGEIVAYIPVASTTTEYSVALKDNSTDKNIIIERSTSGKTFTNGVLKKMKSINVGYIVSITDNSGWTGASAIPALYVQKEDESDNFLAHNNNAYPYKLNKLNDGTLYIALPYTQKDWCIKGKNIKLKFQTEPYDGGHTSQTDCFAVYRDIDITIPSGGGMKAAYRFYVYMSDSQWASWITQGSGTEVVKFTTWDGISTDATNCVKERNADDNGYIFYYEMTSAQYGLASVKYRFFNENNAGWESKDETGVTLNKDIWANAL